jgi:predicted NUDIX family NTP pyrophosphohydrolase
MVATLGHGAMIRSAGLLMYRRRDHTLEVLLVHPGGPLWEGKELESWTMPKGEYDDHETALQAAEREFYEETGFRTGGPYLQLGERVQPSGKFLTAFAFEGDCDPEAVVSNTCVIEWPHGSGQTLEVSEVDRGRWFAVAEARPMIRPGQVEFLNELQERLRARDSLDSVAKSARRTHGLL